MKKSAVVLVKQITILLLVLCVSQFVYADPSPSDPGTFSDLTANWEVTLKNIGVFFEFIAAFTGIILVIAGLVKLKSSGNQQQQQQGGAKVGLAYLLFGGILLTIGTFAIILTNTISHAPTASGGSPAPTPIAPSNIYDAVITYLLVPLLHLINIVGPVIGLAMLAVAIHRLRHHSNPHMMSMHRRSPMASSFYFVVGAILTYPDYVIQAISGSLFRTPQILDQVCPSSTGEGFLSYFKDLHAQSMLVFSDGKLHCVVASSTINPDENLIKLAYAVLFVVGLISFMRGIFLLTLLGEHMGGQDASLSRIVAHVAAGIFAINASVFVGILSETYHLITGVTT